MWWNAKFPRKPRNFDSEMGNKWTTHIGDTFSTQGPRANSSGFGDVQSPLLDFQAPVVQPARPPNPSHAESQHRRSSDHPRKRKPVRIHPIYFRRKKGHAYGKGSKKTLHFRDVWFHDFFHHWLITGMMSGRKMIGILSLIHNLRKQ